MKLARPSAEVYVPSCDDPRMALERTTILAVGAHQDDLEIMAAEGILACYGRDDEWLTAVIVTDGAGSPRDGLYRDLSDERMRSVRRNEQKKAAMLGEYSAVVFLDHASAAVKAPEGIEVVQDLSEVLRATRPRTIYTHNLADKHDTHVAVTLRLVSALRQLPADERPARVLGCEVWRDLDWMVDADKVAMDVSEHENLQAALLGVFDSQICGGKRYDLAALGRRRANATFAASHATDVATGLIYAMDLTPLAIDARRGACEHVRQHVERFASDVAARLERLGAGESDLGERPGDAERGTKW